MRIQIVARHCEVPETVRARAQEQSERLNRFDPRLTGVEIIFDEEKHMKRVEAICTLDRLDPIVATGEGAEFRSALDQSLDRVGRMIRRRREQDTDHQGPKLSEAGLPEV